MSCVAHTLPYAIYAIGFILTVGVFGALWGWQESPAPLFAGMVWPMVLPIVVVHHITKHLILTQRRRAEERRVQAEREDRLLKEAGL